MIKTIDNFFSSSNLHSFFQHSQQESSQLSFSLIYLYLATKIYIIFKVDINTSFGEQQKGIRACVV